jgi:hypothetical protein
MRECFGSTAARVPQLAVPQLAVPVFEASTVSDFIPRWTNA